MEFVTQSTESSEFYQIPGKEFCKRSVSVPYHNAGNDDSSLLSLILDNTPKPKGKTCFSSVHIVVPPKEHYPASIGCKVKAMQKEAQELGRAFVTHELPIEAYSEEAMKEYNAIFAVGYSLILEQADRASLLIFVGSDDTRTDAFAAVIAMLPFRGVQVALLSQREDYGNLLHFTTPSGAFDINAAQSARMGMFPMAAVYGSLPSKNFEVTVEDWTPVNTGILLEKDKLTTELPFKIGGLTLPMITHSAEYETALAGFAELLGNKYPNGYIPIVFCGETCDALGYGSDLLDACRQDDSLYFTHKSGETYKRFDNYASEDLFSKILDAKSLGKTAVIIAVGGGVNGNSSGLIAGMTGVDFIEVPTTPMHYNDATTSAKKAFSLVVNDVIMSKNILGCFYLPQMVYCVNEMHLTISSANVHATVGESSKTMNMLGVANSAVGARDYHNILGGVEFASDFTKILTTVGGFESFVSFIISDEARHLKKAVIAVGEKISQCRQVLKSSRQVMPKKFADRGRAISEASVVQIGTYEDPESQDEEELEGEMENLLAERRCLIRSYRGLFKALDNHKKEEIMKFLTVINKEVVSAKAMFLAYSDPFEKYRALLFEYAHTLGHGIEAFANKLYYIARERSIPVPEAALRLHGQCVGMAVTWAGQMSAELKVLTGEGLDLHQSFVYLFNRFNGFSFKPLKDLCEKLGVTKEELCEGVLQVVRRDNKRGYCKCGANSSVDQLVAKRPGMMLRSHDSNAELRYLVEVDEDLQKQMLLRAFAGDFDKVADVQNGKLVFVPADQSDKLESDSSVVADHIHSRIAEIFADTDRKSVV